MNSQRNLKKQAQDLAKVKIPSVADARWAFRVAARQVRPMVIKFLLQNFMTSGIKSKTGNLAKAIRATKVWVKRGELVWAFPKGLKSAKGDVYTYGNALQYGSVRQPRPYRQVADLPSQNVKAKYRREGILGRRAKTRLKNEMLGTIGQSSRANAWRKGKSNRARKHKVWVGGALSQNRKSKSLSLPVDYTDSEYGSRQKGQVVVTKPFDFYTLTGGQAAKVIEAFQKAVSAFLIREARREGRRRA